MAETKSSAAAAKKFVTVTPARAAEYEAGVRSPRRSWSSSAKANEPGYEQGVQAGITRKAYGKGVTKAGDAKWQHNSAVKGTRNFGPGVQESETAYQQGVEPYIAAIGSITLPPRYARRDPRNLQRVAAIATRLGQVKEAMTK